MSEREQARKLDDLLHGWDTAAWEATIGIPSKQRHAIRMALATYRDALEAALDREERYEKALRLIEDGPVGADMAGLSWAQGVAASALSEPAVQTTDLGMCFWHPNEPFTFGIQLCGDDGIVRRLRRENYTCTGGAHRFGAHIRCTSPAHAALSSPAEPDKEQG